MQLVTVNITVLSPFKTHAKRGKNELSQEGIWPWNVRAYDLKHLISKF